MKQFIRKFVREEEGQDLVEYTLLLAFVCLASAALFIGGSAYFRAFERRFADII